MLNRPGTLLLNRVIGHQLTVDQGVHCGATSNPTFWVANFIEINTGVPAIKLIVDGIHTSKKGRDILHGNIHQAGFGAVGHWLPIVGAERGGPDIAAAIGLIVGVFSLYRTTGFHIYVASPSGLGEFIR